MSVFAQLLNRHEGAGNYDTLFGHSQRPGGRFEGVRPTQMTIGEMLDFQSPSGPYGQWVKSQVGRVATPAGAGQIVGTTLRNVVRQHNIPMNTPFNQQTQDFLIQKLAEARLNSASTMAGKRAALRAEWEGFKSVPDATLNQAIYELEGRQRPPAGPAAPVAGDRGAPRGTLPGTTQNSTLLDFGIERGNAAQQLADGVISALDYVSPDIPNLRFDLPDSTEEQTAAEELLGIDFDPFINAGKIAAPTPSQTEQMQAMAQPPRPGQFAALAGPQMRGAPSANPAAMAVASPDFGFGAASGAPAAEDPPVFGLPASGLAMGTDAPTEPVEPAVSGGTPQDTAAAQAVPPAAGEDPSTLYTPTPTDSPEGARNKTRRREYWMRLAYGAGSALSQLGAGQPVNLAQSMAQYDATQQAGQGLPFTPQMAAVLQQVDPSGRLTAIAQQAAQTGNKGLYNTILGEYTDFLGDQRDWSRDNFTYARGRRDEVGDRQEQRRFDWLTTQEQREYDQGIWERDQVAAIQAEARQQGYQIAQKELDQAVKAREGAALAGAMASLEQGATPAQIFEAIQGRPDISPATVNSVAEAARAGLTSSIKEATRLFQEPEWMEQQGYTNFGEVLDHVNKTTSGTQDVGSIIEAAGQQRFATESATRLDAYLTEVNDIAQANNASNVVLRSMEDLTQEQLASGALPTGMATPYIRQAMSWFSSLGLDGMRQKIEEATNLPLSDLQQLNVGQLALAYQFASENVRGTGQITENERKEILAQMPNELQTPAERLGLTRQMLELNRIEQMAGDYMIDEYQRARQEGRFIDPQILKSGAERLYGRYAAELVRAKRAMTKVEVGEIELTEPNAATAKRVLANVEAGVAQRLQLGNNYWDPTASDDENLRRLGWK